MVNVAIVFRANIFQNFCVLGRQRTDSLQLPRFPEGAEVVKGYFHLEMPQVRTLETLDYVHLLGLRKIIVGEPCSIVEPHGVHSSVSPSQRPTECPMKDGLGSLGWLRPSRYIWRVGLPLSGSMMTSI